MTPGGPHVIRALRQAGPQFVNAGSSFAFVPQILSGTRKSSRASARVKAANFYGITLTARRRSGLRRLELLLGTRRFQARGGASP